MLKLSIFIYLEALNDFFNPPLLPPFLFTDMTCAIYLSMDSRQRGILAILPKLANSCSLAQKELHFNPFTFFF